jgi:hypothetical protein
MMLVIVLPSPSNALIDAPNDLPCRADGPQARQIADDVIPSVERVDHAKGASALQPRITGSFVSSCEALTSATLRSGRNRTWEGE